jgi:drug/metabolite transporter (DMT)-like permease
MAASTLPATERGLDGAPNGTAGGRVISYVLAFLGALANAMGNTLNRKASRDEPAQVQFRLKMFADLVHRPAWLSAIGLMTVSFLLASAALGTGQLASVQLVIVLELPLTLIGGSVLLGARLGVRDWAAIAVMTGGVIGLLALLNPRPGPSTTVAPTLWILGSAANGGAVLVLYLAARAHPRPATRAVLLGIGAGFSYGLTAAFTKGMADQFNEGGISAVFSSWELYACVGAGLVSVWLLQNAYEAGPLTASQPGITLVDPIISTLWGVVVFGEQVNQGALLALTPLPLIAVAAGAVVLSRSLVLHVTQTGRDQAEEGRRPDLAGAGS